MFFAVTVLFATSMYLYPESVKIMSGDYMLGRWVETIETNKSWILVFFLAFCGACIGYMVYRLYKKYFVIIN